MEDTSPQPAALLRQLGEAAAALAAAAENLARAIGNDKNISNLLDNNQEIKKENAKERKKEKTEVDTRAYVSWFNKTLREAGATIPHQCKWTQRRDNAIRARCREHGKQALVEACRRMAESDFLNGRNNGAWTATIDWMLRPNNFTKIIEGNYDNDRNNATGTGASRGAASPRRGWDVPVHADADYDEDF